MILKLTPILFVLPLLLTRNWKALAGLCIALLVWMGAAALRYGPEHFITYVDVFRWISSTAPQMAENPQPLVGKLAFTLFNTFHIIPALPDENSLRPLQTMLTGYCLAVFAFSGVLHLRTRRTDLLFMTLLLVIVLASNIAWYHHYVFLLLVILLMLRQWGQHRSVWIFSLIWFSLIQFERYFPLYGLSILLCAHGALLALTYYHLRLWRTATRTVAEPLPA